MINIDNKCDQTSNSDQKEKKMNKQFPFTDLTTACLSGFMVWLGRNDDYQVVY